jgi:hypothetical protein
VVKVLIFIKMVFIFSTPVFIRHLLQLKTVVLLHWCPIHALLLNKNEGDISVIIDHYRSILIITFIFKMAKIFLRGQDEIKLY